MNNYHRPVMAQEAIDLLNIRREGIYADLTFGGGGHSALILSALGSKGRLYSFDQDSDAKANIPDDDRFTFINGNFKFMRNYLRAEGVTELDGVLADLGVSSHHFDTPERGFSFRFDAELDMRMNTQGGLSAKEVLNKYDADRLTAVLKDYGEIERPWKVASLIDKYRSEKPLERIGDLIGAVAPVTPRKDANKFLSRLFQAIRIEVNGEMEALKMALEQSAKMLKPGGRLVVISYHSLEDRIVKNFFRSGNTEGKTEKDFFGNETKELKIITRKAMLPTDAEIGENPRARSAKTRAAEKI